MSKENIKNDLEVTRRTRGLSRKQVSRFLGYRGTSAIASYERGVAMPKLITALGLEIIYRRPVAFLYPSLYEKLRSEIRAKEVEASGEQHHG